MKKQCSNCGKEGDKDFFWPNRKICKVCFHNKYQKITCKKCSYQYSKTAKECKFCKYDNGKICNQCQEKLNIDQFYQNKNKKYRSVCIKCEKYNSKKYKQENPHKNKQWRQDWAKRNPDKVKLSSIKQKIKQHKYEGDLNDKILLIKNKQKCESCGNKFDNYHKKHIDHCHKTNKLRGVLCRSCNHALGFAKDSPEILKNLIIYLEKYS